MKALEKMLGKKKPTKFFSVFVCIIWRVVFRPHFQTSTAIPKEGTFKLLRLWVGVSGHPLPSPPVKWQLQLAQSQRQSEKILPAAVLEGATSNKMSPYIAKHAAPWCFKWHCNRSIQTIHTNCSFYFSALSACSCWILSDWKCIPLQGLYPITTFLQVKHKSEYIVFWYRMILAELTYMGNHPKMLEVKLKW